MLCLVTIVHYQCSCSISPAWSVYTICYVTPNTNSLCTCFSSFFFLAVYGMTSSGDFTVRCTAGTLHLANKAWISEDREAESSTTIQSSKGMCFKVWQRAVRSAFWVFRWNVGVIKNITGSCWPSRQGKAVCWINGRTTCTCMYTAKVWRMKYSCHKARH